MTLSQKHVSSRCVAVSLKSVTIVLTATTILAGRMTAAGSIDWDFVLTMVIISSATSEANILQSALIPHLIVAPIPNMNEKNEENSSLTNHKTQTYRFTEENLKRIVRPSMQNIFSGKISNMRDLNNLLRPTENISKVNSFSSHLVNLRDRDSEYFNTKTLYPANDYESIAQRRSVDTNTCAEILTSSFCKCDEASVICESLNLSELVFDKPFPKEIKIISVAQNHLSEIPNISGAGNIIEMILAHNKIKEADMRKLANFSSLEILNLSFNELQVLDLTPLVLRNFRVLNVSHNRLEKLIPPIDILPFTDLFLERNDITDVSFLMNFTHLQTLNISYNRVRYISENVFQHLSDLNTLDLRNNQIVNAEFISFIPRHLTTLTLSNNKISYIPDQAFKNKLLVNLFLDNNSLRKVSFVIYLNVAVLKLNNNPLFKINGNFFTIRNLRILDLSETNITSMDFIFSIPRLTELRIKDNNITSLPEMGFKNYPSLKRLFLQGNPLEDLSCSVSSTRKCVDEEICKECKLCVMIDDVVIYLNDENMRCKINCVNRFRPFTTKCKQSNNSASQMLISIFLVLFFNVINVL